MHHGYPEPASRWAGRGRGGAGQRLRAPRVHLPAARQPAGQGLRRAAAPGGGGSCSPPSPQATPRTPPASSRWARRRASAPGRANECGLHVRGHTHAKMQAQAAAKGAHESSIAAARMPAAGGGRRHALTLPPWQTAGAQGWADNMSTWRKTGRHRVSQLVRPFQLFHPAIRWRPTAAQQEAGATQWLECSQVSSTCEHSFCCEEHVAEWLLVDPAHVHPQS